MYIKYNSTLYRYSKKNREILTYYTEKTDETFKPYSKLYYKEIELDDEKIEDIYDVDFYVYYMDDSETLKNACVSGIWCVNEGKPLYRTPKIEENELGLGLDNLSLSEDWIRDDRSSCSKIVNLYDCKDYTVKYKYIFKNGKVLSKEEVVKEKMDAEEFKAEMLKYRTENI